MENSGLTEKQKNFKRISENRVNKILTLFDQLKNLKNRSFYDYSDEDIEKIFNILQEELDNTKKSLQDSKSIKGKRFEL